MRAANPDQDTLFRYTQGKLNEAEEEQVELWLMENPNALEDARIDEVFLRCIDGSAGKKTMQRGRWLFGGMRYALAAGVGFLIATAVPISNYFSSNPAMLRAEQHFLEATRTGSPKPEIISVGSEILLLELAVPTDPAPDQVWIRLDQGSRAQDLGKIAVGWGKSAVIALDLSQLELGSEIQLTILSRNEEILASYAFVIELARE